MENDKLLKSLFELKQDLEWLDNELSSELNKGPNYWKGKDPKKYAAALKRLARDRKTPGSKERGYQQVLQGKRRERGGSGTTAGQNGKSGHSSGHNKQDTGTAAKRFASSEKKAGKKLSQDRINNNKGYVASNVRNVPQDLNRGDENNKKKKKYLSGKSKK